MTKKQPGIIYKFDDEDEMPSEVAYLYGRLATVLFEIQTESKKEKNDGECFNISGGLRKKEKMLV